MQRPISKDALVALLRTKARRAGTQAALAHALRVTPGYLSEVLQGTREPGPKILQALGLQRVTMFKRAKGGGG